MRGLPVVTPAPKYLGGAAEAGDRLGNVQGGCSRRVQGIRAGGEGAAGRGSVGRAARISIPDRPAGEICRARELKRPCTQEKESPVNRLSVILFGAVPILLAPALLGCGTGGGGCVSPLASWGAPVQGTNGQSVPHTVPLGWWLWGRPPPKP